MDQLIPILLRADNTSDSVGARDLIFWYKPTPEFLALLPDSARAVAQTMANGTNNAAASVTDVHGAIQQAIPFPNPSKGSFPVQLTLGRCANAYIYASEFIRSASCAARSSADGWNGRAVARFQHSAGRCLSPRYFLRSRRALYRAGGNRALRGAIP